MDEANSRKRYMRAVVIGSSGQLGSDIVRVFKKNKIDVTPLTHKQIEVSNYSSVKKTLDRLNFDLVINTAAHHRVDEIELNPQLAFQINSFGAHNIAKYANTKNKRVIFISTDYVFGQDEKRKIPYTETDKPAPVNIYGVSKVSGELLTALSSPNHIIVRTSGLFGIMGASGKGGNFVETMIRKAKAKEEIQVVGDQRLSPTYTANLAQQICQLSKSRQNGLFHAVSEGECSWWEFAREIFKITGLGAKLKKTNSKKWKTAAKRPAYSVLANSRLNRLNLSVMNSWQKSLLLYLEEKGHLKSATLPSLPQKKSQ